MKLIFHSCVFSELGFIFFKTLFFLENGNNNLLVTFLAVY